MMLPIRLKCSAVAAIVDCPVRDQFTGSLSLKPVPPRWIWLFQETPNTMPLSTLNHRQVAFDCSHNRTREGFITYNLKGTTKIHVRGY